MSKTTESELISIMSKPENSNRVAIRVYESGDRLTAEYEGNVVEAETAFQLDSKLDLIGVPIPRNLFLMEDK